MTLLTLDMYYYRNRLLKNNKYCLKLCSDKRRENLGWVPWLLIARIFSGYAVAFILLEHCNVSFAAYMHILWLYYLYMRVAKHWKFVWIFHILFSNKSTTQYKKYFLINLNVQFMLSRPIQTRVQIHTNMSHITWPAHRRYYNVQLENKTQTK